MKEGWEYKKFSEVFDLQMGRTPARDNKSYWEGTNLWVSIGDMGDCKYIINTKESISDIAIKEAKMPIVPPNTALMSFKLSIGKTAITTRSLCTNEAIMAFIPKEGIDVSSEFLYYYLSHYKWEGNRAAMGKTINKRIISDAIITLPPLPVQQSIVAELDKINEIIDLKKEQLKDLDLLAQSIFYDMFGDPIENPKGWEVKKLGEVCTKITDGTHKTPTYIETGCIFVSAKNIKNNELTYDDVKYISQEEFDILDKRCNPRVGDLLICKSGTIGYCTIINKDIPIALFESLALLKVKDEIVDNKYLKAIINCSVTQNTIKKRIKGNSIKHLHLNELKTLGIILPPLSLQQSFSSKIQAIESQKSAIKQSLAEMETLLASRMDYWFG